MTVASPRRFDGTDAARAFALLLMTCTHTLRVASPSSHSDLSSWLMRLEPVTPTLFALLAGAGLAASQTRRSLSDWRSRHLLRALALVALSWLLFLPYHGPQWPESLVSTGILQCLGTGIALVALLGSPVATGLVGVAALVGWTWLDQRGIRLDGLNQGSFPLFPYVPLMLLSHSWTSLSERREGLRSMLSIGAVLMVVAIAVSPGFRNVWGEWGMTWTHQVYQVSSEGGGGLGLIRDLASGYPVTERTMTFWHTRPQLVPLLVALAALVIVFFRTATRYVPSDVRLLSRLGRHSLPYYLGHFLGLGALSLLPHELRHGRWTWAAGTILMIALGIAYATWRERRPKEPTP